MRLLIGLGFLLGSCGSAFAHVHEHIQAVERSVRDYIHSDDKDGSRFALSDHEAGRIRKLTLADIPPEKITTFSNGNSVVCARFRDSNGDKVDVDFDLDTLNQVEGVQIRRVNGEPR